MDYYKKTNRKRIIYKPIILTLLVIGGTSLNSFSQIQKGQDMDGEDVGNISGYSVSMPDANTVAIGAPDNDGNGPGAGHVRVYLWTGSVWAQKGQDINGEDIDDWSGISLSMPDANTVAIGAGENNGNGPDAGHVRVYSWNNSAWVQKGQDINGETAGDLSGTSVSMPDPNTIAIGAPFNNGSIGPNAGHVRVFSWDGSTWLQKGLDIDGESFGDLSGSSVSMPDSNTLAIGAPWNQANGTGSGHVRVFSWNGSTWIQKGLDLDGKTFFNLFGRAVSMPDANTVAIGAPYNQASGLDTGYVGVYFWNGSSWAQKGYDITGEDIGDLSGWSVSMPDSNTVAIGARENHGNGSISGQVRVHSFNGNTWTQLGPDINGEAAGDQLGYSVSMPDENTVAIGAPYNDGINGLDAGHVRVFSGFSAVGFFDNSFTDKINLHPNPTSGTLIISFDTIQEELNVSLFSLDGKLIYSRLNNYLFNTSFEIETPKGVYLLKIYNNFQAASMLVVKK